MGAMRGLGRGTSAQAAMIEKIFHDHVNSAAY